MPKYSNPSLQHKQFMDRFQALAINMIKWNGLPDTIDERFLEYTLFCDGFVSIPAEDLAEIKGTTLAKTKSYRR